MKIFNKYKKHHQVLKFLNDKYSKHKEKNIDLYCISLKEISKIIEHSSSKTEEISTFKTEKILTDLKEYECVDFKKEKNSYKISDKGIRKYKSHYFLEKQKDYFIKNLKDFLGITVSVLAIATFFITIGLKQMESNKSQKEVKKLRNKVENIEKFLNSNKPKQKILNDTLKTDSLKTD